MGEPIVNSYSFGSFGGGGGGGGGFLTRLVSSASCTCFLPGDSAAALDRFGGRVIFLDHLEPEGNAQVAARESPGRMGRDRRPSVWQSVCISRKLFRNGSGRQFLAGLEGPVVRLAGHVAGAKLFELAQAKLYSWARSLRANSRPSVRL